MTSIARAERRRQQRQEHAAVLQHSPMIQHRDVEKKRRTATQIAIEMSELRGQLAEASKGPKEGETAEVHVERRDKIVNRLAELEPEYRTALVEERTQLERENRAWRELRPGVSLVDYLRACADAKPLEGRAAELNQELQLPEAAGITEIPLRLFAPETEERAAIDVSGTANLDAYVGQPRPWLDRLVRMTQAQRLGVTFDSVAVGEAIYPLTTTATSAHQVQRGDAIGESAFAFTLTKLTGKRYGASYRLRIEDLRTVPGLEAAIRRDVELVMGLHVDSAVFLGKDPTGTGADITGLNAATGVKALTLTAANAIKALEIYKVIGGLSDGIRMTRGREANLVLSDKVQAKLEAAVMGSTDTASMTLMSEWLAEHIMGYGVYNGLSANATPASNDIVGIGSMPRGLPGAAVVAMWPSVQMIRDPYSSAQKGEVVVTMQGLYDFAVIRPNQFFKITVS
ncbi:MAG: phage major capsid protein [Deltaproteobacteria bacterium]|nr:phage major capsid protein [Deltaproteobacteria bacterium]